MEARKFLVGNAATLCRGLPCKGVLLSILVFALNFLLIYAVRRFYPMLRDKKAHHRRAKGKSDRDKHKQKHKDRRRHEKTTPKVLLLLGLPGSGKTRWLKQYSARCDDSYVVVEEDKMRTEITGKFDDFSREEDLCRAMVSAILENLNSKRNVVVESNRYVMDEEFRKRIISGAPPCQFLVKEFNIKARFAKERLDKDGAEGKVHHAYEETELEELEARLPHVRELMNKERWSWLP